MVQQPKASDVKRIKQSRQTQRHALKRSSKRLRTSALTAADVLGQRDLAQHIFSFLSPRELARVAGVCRLWRDISSCTRLWEPICQVLAGADRLTELWRDKTHVPARQLAAAGSITYKDAHLQSLRDAQHKTLTVQELCTLPWQFRFQLAAGLFFVQSDPYYSGEGRPMRRHFHPDGTITAEASDPFFGPHESQWRFTKTKVGRRGKGQYVKVNHWPALEIRRNPVNWSFILCNDWVIYTADGMQQCITCK